MLFGKGNNTIVLRKWFWHFVGIICHTILEGKSTGIQTWFLVKPFLSVLQSLATQGKLSPLWPRLTWPRLNVQGEAKTQFLATNSAELWMWAPQSRPWQLSPPCVSCQQEHQAVPDAWANLSSSLVGFVAHQTPECCQSCCLRVWTDSMGQAHTTWRKHCLLVL